MPNPLPPSADPSSAPPGAFAASDPAAPHPRSVTFRAVAIGVLLLPVNAYWVACMELVRYSAHPSTLSLFFNCIFELLVLSLLNTMVARISPRRALCQGELLLIYSMLAIGTALSGHDTLQVLVPMLAWPVYQANTANHWNELFATAYPHILVLHDHEAALGFFRGNSTLYTVSHLRAWAVPVAVWSAFLVTLLFIMQCLNAILRKQWTETERLTYPLVRLPLEMTSNAPGTMRLLHNRLFWVGFALAAGIDIINSLNYYFPSIPPIFTPGNGKGYYDLGIQLTQRPWNAVGSVPFSFYPFVVGLGLLMPTDFLFSSWFFFLFWRLEAVLVVANALDADPLMPYANYQSFGAYMFFFVSSLWLARGYLKQVWRCAAGLPSEVDDSDEPIRYRTAFLGIAGGMVAVIAFSIAIGFAWWLAILFFLIYFSLAIAITRMRAELGTPIHDLHQTGPDTLLPTLIGPRNMPHSELGAFALFFWFNRAYRNCPMPIQLEAFKMCDVSARKHEQRGWFWALMLAGVVGVLSGFWALLHLIYQFGALAGASNVAMNAFGNEPWNRLTNWLNQPKGANSSVLTAGLVGFLFASFLQFMRIRFPWWPFHPLAFAVSSSSEIHWVWFPLFLAWMIKSVLMRYGGIQAYRTSLPFFYGLMLGQFVEGSILNIWGISTHTPTYQFWQ